MIQFSYKKLIAFLVLQVFLVSGGLFGFKAICIEQDGDTFATNLLAGDTENANDHFESDWMRDPCDDPPNDDNLHEDCHEEEFLVVLASDEVLTAQNKITFENILLKYRSGSPFLFSRIILPSPYFEVPDVGSHAPPPRIHEIRSVILLC